MLNILVYNRIAQYKYLFEMAKDCPPDTAILFRNNDSALPLIDLFEKNGLPYNCRAFDGVFFSSRVINDIRDIINFAMDMKNGETFMRIYYKLGVRIPKEAAQEACRLSAKKGSEVLVELWKGTKLGKKTEEFVFDLIDNFREIPSDTAVGALERIRYTMGYGKYVKRSKLDPAKLPILTMLARDIPNPLALLERLDELRNIILNHKNSPDCPLTLSTIHSSKGLEYENVYLLDVLDGVLPLKPEGELAKGEIKNYQEERRIFYVGMTRARQGLNMFSVSGEAGSFVSEVRKILNPEGDKKPRILNPFAWEKEKTPVGEFKEGERVRHKFFGTGLVTAVSGDLVSVCFDETGETKRFYANAAPMKKI